MKRKLGSHPNWRRIIAHRYTAARAVAPRAPYSGVIALYSIERVTMPLWKPLAGQPVQLAADGFAWLQFYPSPDPTGSGSADPAVTYALTAMVAPDGDVRQWYLDIAAGCGTTPDGIPWHDDLYLDLVTAGRGDIELLDADELEEALIAGDETPARYHAAWDLAHRLTPTLRALDLPEIEALAPALAALRALESGEPAPGYHLLYREG